MRAHGAHAHPDHPSRRALVEDSGHPLTALQSAAGNRAVQRLLADEVAVQRYREKTAMNVGAMDGGTLVESPFRNAKKQPWISLITVESDSVVPDASGVDMPEGTATATYFANPAALSSFSFEVDRWAARSAQRSGALHGGPDRGSRLQRPRCRRRHRRQTRRRSAGGTQARRAPAVHQPTPGQNRATLLASMSLAVFYNAGEAFHNAPANVASHGCLHVVDAKLIQLNYHSVVGRTKVNVKYTGAAKAVFDP